VVGLAPKLAQLIFVVNDLTFPAFPKRAHDNTSAARRNIRPP
jgi:hypothetical protein